MGRRGPPAKPRALKKAQGTYRKDRDPQLDALAAKIPAGAPPMPSDLDDDAKKRWCEIVPELLRVQALSMIDGGALEAYCRSYGRWSALEAMAREQPIVKTKYGLKVNPAGGEARKLHKEVVQPLELALGLHFAARSRLRMPKGGDDEDPQEEFLFAPKVIQGGKGL